MHRGGDVLGRTSVGCFLGVSLLVSCGGPGESVHDDAPSDGAGGEQQGDRAGDDDEPAQVPAPPEDDDRSAADGNASASAAPSAAPSGRGGTPTSEGAGGAGGVGGGPGASNEAGAGGSTAGSENGGANAGAAGAGDEPGDPGQHCEGGPIIDVDGLFGRLTGCGGPVDHRGFDIANPIDAAISNLALPEPLVAGEPNALSFEISEAGRGGYELWGASEECGVAEELLWYSDMQGKILCAEFTPSRSYTHLFFVVRSYESGNFAALNENFGLCSGGTCPTPDGTARVDAEPFLGPQKAYRSMGSQLYKGYGVTLGLWGRLIALGESRGGTGDTMEVTTGVFKAPTPFEQYGDAYYCAGPGSTITNQGEDGVDVSLRNITRLVSCDQLSGSTTLSLSKTGNAGELESSFDLLNLADDIVHQRCFERACDWQISDIPKVVWLDLVTENDVGNIGTPTFEPSAVIEATVFYQELDESPLYLGCAHSGSAYFDPEGTTTLELEDLSEFVTCPGEAIENDSTDFHLY